MNDKPQGGNAGGRGRGLLWAALIATWTTFVYIFFFLRFVSNYIDWGGGG